jgi:hypothetical protein
MGLNDRGWTEIMEGNLVPGQQNSASGKLLNGRAAIDIDGLNFDLGTLGGKNSWMNYGGLNEKGEAVGDAETSVPDPNGEDVCGFGTGLTCRPFLWKNDSMRALPTLGGNNGQASAINNHGQIAGYAENGIVDSTCPPNTTNNRIDLRCCGKKAKPNLFLRWVAIQTGSRGHQQSRPSCRLLGNLHVSESRRTVGKRHRHPA